MYPHGGISMMRGLVSAVSYGATLRASATPSTPSNPWAIPPVAATTALHVARAVAINAVKETARAYPVGDEVELDDQAARDETANAPSMRLYVNGEFTNGIVTIAVAHTERKANDVAPNRQDGEAGDLVSSEQDGTR
jgi:hypothetical protein